MRGTRGDAVRRALTCIGRVATGMSVLSRRLVDAAQTVVTGRVGQHGSGPSASSAAAERQGRRFLTPGHDNVGLGQLYG